MDNRIIELISSALSLQPQQVGNTINLLEDGATIPFISRYRKERTGNLDEVQVQDISDKKQEYEQVEKRKATILHTIENQGALTTELQKTIENTFESNALEDLYLPYKPKRQTRGSKAREAGIEPLAKDIFNQKDIDTVTEAKKYISENFKNENEVLHGARDIIAEWINENKNAREITRKIFKKEAQVVSKVVKDKKEEGQKYTDYFDYSESLQKIPSHRFLAISRANNEGILRVKLEVEDERVINDLTPLFIQSRDKTGEELKTAIKDSFKRLIYPSIEREFMKEAKEKADTEAIKVFADNLKQLLLAPPLGNKRILAIDPGYQSGSKIVCLDQHGNLEHNETIYPHPPHKELKKASRKIASLANAYNIEAIAIGNGTASRETENFIRTKVNFDKEVQVFVVNEDGASVYSASSIAREEFPKYDVTVRGAVSIGRRLMDPLAELVKIDPKSLGIGQYQHDVDQKLLNQKLDQVVESVVNSVGVDINTAGKYLLIYISGIGRQQADNIEKYRNENGNFSSKEELKHIPKIGPKAYEQAAGFLRIKNPENPLDNTAIHPEAYHIVEKMAKSLDSNLKQLIENNELRNKIKPQDFVNDEFGLPTINDILKELEKPGRDVRGSMKTLTFSKNIFSIDDINEGMILPGIITNVTNFGAFVDIGIKENGLIHISKLADKYVSDPTEIVNLHQYVKVKILEVDRERKRIQLSFMGSF